MHKKGKMGLRQKIEWRVRLVGKALYLRAKFGAKADWKDIFKEVFSSHSKAKVYVQPRLIAEDGEFGLYQIGEHRVFFPLAFDPSFLGFVYEEIFVRQVYERGECRIRPGGWVVDAGACEGLFSLYALRKGVNVLAFEPVPELAQALKKTLAEFIQAGRARVFPLALGEEEGKGTLHCYYSDIAGSTLSQEVLNVRGDSNEVVRQEKVSVVSLDSLLQDLPPISFIKADVEGSERELLLGAQEVIRRYRPCLSICTYHRPDDWWVIPEIIARLCGSEGVCSQGKYRIKFGGPLGHLYGWYEGRAKA